MYHDLTEEKISRSLLQFALPMMAGNLLQQFYNIADMLIVGRVLGSNALAAVGSAYTLMTFLTSIFWGLSMGSGALFSIYKGKNDSDALQNSSVHAFVLTVISLGTCVALAYLLSNYIGEIGIWMAIPIGWVLADAVGLIHMKFHKIPSTLLLPMLFPASGILESRYFRCFSSTFHTALPF